MEVSSLNRPRGIVFLSCLLLLCLIDSSEPSVATVASASAEKDDSGDEFDINDAIKVVDSAEENGDTIDVEAVVDERSVEKTITDQHDGESDLPATLSSNEEQPKSQEDVLLGVGETIDISNDLDDENNKQELQYTPPTHFQITAHVQTNLHTGLSYFLPSESLPTSFAHLPFLECGAIGSTTESLPLVSGVFRHVPHTAVVPKRDEATMDVVFENLEQVMEKDNAQKDTTEGGDGNKLNGLDMLDEDEEKNKSKETNNHDTSSSSDGIDDTDSHPKRPSPPKYVVALSPMEVTVGGNGNETQKFHPGDVIFIEDTWWGVWDNDEDIDSLNNHDDMLNENIDVEAAEGSSGESQDTTDAGSKKMKGYIMRASSETETDLNVLMLTVPNAIHRHWKNAQYAMAMARREEQRVAKQQEKQQSSLQTGSLNTHNNEFGTRRPWWKMPTAFLNKQGSRQQEEALPKPCSLESDPAFAHPSAMSSTTLSQHFTQHFTGLLRRSTNPHPSFLPHHHQDLLLPILAQTAAAMIGGAASLALVLQLWRIIPGPIAVGFGSACLIGFGTWGIVWLGEEILDQWELWRERRRLEKMMSEGWGKGGSGT